MPSGGGGVAGRRERGKARGRIGGLRDLDARGLRSPAAGSCRGARRRRREDGPAELVAVGERGAPNGWFAAQQGKSPPTRGPATAPRDSAGGSAGSDSSPSGLVSEATVEGRKADGEVASARGRESKDTKSSVSRTGPVTSRCARLERVIAISGYRSPRVERASPEASAPFGRLRPGWFDVELSCASARWWSAPKVARLRGTEATARSRLR